MAAFYLQYGGPLLSTVQNTGAPDAIFMIFNAIVEGFTPHHKVSLGGSEVLAPKTSFSTPNPIGINRHIVR